MHRGTIIRIASPTTPITAVATMTRVEQCALRLDEPVERLLPELADCHVRSPRSPRDHPPLSS